MKKFYLFSLFLVLSLVKTNAQLQVSLNVDPHPTPEISEWVNRTNLAILTVTNTDPSMEDVEYRIKVEMYKDGNMMLETNDNVNAQYVEIGVVTFLADEIIPYSAIHFTNLSFRHHVLQTGMLPAGEYSFCVTLLDVNNNVISAPNPECKPMLFTDYQMPELISPISNTVIDSQLAPTIIFNWTPVTPQPPADLGVKYSIEVKEILANQSATQAFHVNNAIISEEVLIGTQFNWPSDLDAPDETTQYVWSIKAISTSNDNPYQQGNNGFVPIQTFTINYVENPTDVDCNCTNSTTQPELTVTEVDPINNPGKLQLTNVIQLSDFVFACNDSISSTSHTITTKINWDSTHYQELVSNSGPFEHVYSLTHLIPTEICINMEVTPNAGYYGGECSKEFCVTVPQNILDLNTGGSVVVTDTIYAGHNGEFAIIPTEITESAGKITGKGSVFVDFLQARMAVKFDSITVDTNNKLMTGIVLVENYPTPAPVYPQDWALEIVANNGTANSTATSVANWGNDKADEIITWTNSTSGNVVSWVNDTTGSSISDPNIVLDDPAIPTGPLTDNTTPVKVPLGVNMPNGDQLAITEMVFRHDKSEFNLVAAKNTPANWGPIQLVGFEAKNIQFHPTQIVTPPERIELIEDVSIGNQNNDVFFTFIAPEGADPGCYIEWDDDGFSEYGIEIDASFTRDWFTPVPDDGSSKSKANLIATGTDWNDLVLTGNFEKSEIVTADGMTILANTISYDMSDVLNPPNMEFPDNYPSGAETSNLFRGFYMKQLEVELPEGLQTQSGGAPKISIQDMIINNSGLTLYAEVTNVYQYPDVGMVDMSASIDTVRVNISGGSLVQAGIKGRLALPISKSDSVQNPLQYNAIFHVAQTSAEMTHFQLTIDPTGPVNADLLKGKMTFDPTSSIVAYFDKNKRTFQSTLNGNFVWDDVTLGPVKHINFDMGFQNVEFNYNSSLQNNKMQFNAGVWAFASPQKMLANFPVTIENIGFTDMNTTGTQLLHGKLNFDVIFNLSDNIGGQSTFGVEVGIDENSSGSGLGKFVPQYIGTGVEDISIHAHLPPVSIEGSISFRTNDPVFGDGFKGDLSATFKAPKFGITALAEFGNTDYLYTSTYRYWRIEAAALFQPGIPFLPGVAFYGFGGGAHNNMEAELVEAVPSVPAHYTFKPKKGTMGFKVKATIGTTPKVETFNADVGLNGQFSSSQGLINIGFTGDFYVGAPLMPDSKRQEAQIKGSVLADYNFPNKHFYLGVNADIDKDPIEALNQSLVLDINGQTNKWFFKFGEPTNTNTASIFGVSLYQYIMFGNDIQGPVHGFTTDFYNGYHDAMGSYPGIPDAPGIDTNSATGKGLALGIGIKFNKGVDKHIYNGYNFYAALNAAAEVNLSMMEYIGQNCANTSQSIGINGWRARGSIGFYTVAGMGVKKGSKTWALADFKVGGWIDAKFPRPTYVTGAIEGQIRIGPLPQTKIHLLGDCKGGDGGAHWHRIPGKVKLYGIKSCVHYNPPQYLLNKNFQSSFEWAPNGDYCGSGDTSQPTNTASTVTQQDAASDQEQNLIKYVHPGTTYHFPTTMPIAVRYGLPLNETFDVTQQQADGSVITRTFKLQNTVLLQVKNATTGLFENSYTTTDQNNLGEYLYTKGSGVIVAQASAFNAPALANPTSGNTNQNQQAFGHLAQMPMGTGSAQQPMTMATSSQQFTLYPAPTPPQTSEYDNLPPEVDPVVNSLAVDTTYKIIITATLREYVGSHWENAHKLDGSDVTQTISKTFRTGAMETVSAAGSITR